jgi:hypothetical protein
MHGQTCVDVRYSTVGLCEAVPHTNHTAATVQNSAVHNQRAAVRLQPHATQWLAYPICRHGDQPIIPPLPPSAGESSQRSRHCYPTSATIGWRLITTLSSLLSNLCHHRLATHHNAHVTAIQPRPPSAGESSQRFRHCAGHPTSHSKKIDETMADRLIYSTLQWTLNLVPCITHFLVYGVSLLNDFSLLVKLF